MAIPDERKKRRPRKPPPRLDLMPNDVTEPTPLTLLAIKSVMFYPDDGMARIAFVKSRALRLADDAVRKGTSLSVSEMEQWRNDALEILPLTDKRFEAEKDRRGRDGICAGALLFQAVGKREALTPLKKKITDILFGHKLMVRTADGKIHTGSNSAVDNRIWKTFRPVAHFWAAFLLMHKDGERIDDFLDRMMDDVIQFLMTADKLRLMAEKTRQKHAIESVLRPGGSVLLPEFMRHLPHPEIEFASVD
jgi:hypothetical protein